MQRTIYIYCFYELLVSNSFLFLLVRHLLLVAMRLFLVASCELESIRKDVCMAKSNLLGQNGNPKIHENAEPQSGWALRGGVCVIRVEFMFMSPFQSDWAQHSAVAITPRFSDIAMDVSSPS